MKRATRSQFAALRRSDLSDYTVEAHDGPIGRLSARTAEADGTVLVVELGPLLFGELVTLRLEALTEIDPDTETILVDHLKTTGATSAAPQQKTRTIRGQPRLHHRHASGGVRDRHPVSEDVAFWRKSDTFP